MEQYEVKIMGFRVLYSSIKNAQLVILDSDKINSALTQEVNDGWEVIGVAPRGDVSIIYTLRRKLPD